MEKRTGSKDMGCIHKVLAIESIDEIEGVI
jgi:hypothetical protein